MTYFRRLSPERGFGNGDEVELETQSSILRRTPDLTPKEPPLAQLRPSFPHVRFRSAALHAPALVRKFLLQEPCNERQLYDPVTQEIQCGEVLGAYREVLRLMQKVIRDEIPGIFGEFLLSHGLN